MFNHSIRVVNETTGHTTAPDIRVPSSLNLDCFSLIVFVLRIRVTKTMVGNISELNPAGDTAGGC